ITSTALSSARCSTIYSRTISRNPSASHRSRPKTACCRHGPGSPAASARIHPVLRRSSPSRPSTNRPAFNAVRSCSNNGRIRFFTSRSDDAHNASVVSIDAPVIHDLRIMVTHGFRNQQNAPAKNYYCNANRHVIKARVPNEYLPELIKQRGETTVRGILETHFISRSAFDILLRTPFTPADFEAFIADRQRILQDAI